MIASCKTSSLIDFARLQDNSSDHRIEITFVNSEANQLAIMSAIQQNGFSAEIEFRPVGNFCPCVIVLSCHCQNVSNNTFMKFKNTLASCSGVVRVTDLLLQ